MRTAAAGIFLILAGQAANAAGTAHLWIALPSHKNILVDMGSIKPLPHAPSAHGVKFWDTSVAVKVNGIFYADFWMDCFPRVKHEPGDNEIHLEGGKILRVPAEVVEDLVCPKAWHR